MMNEPLSSIMTRDVVTVGPDIKLSVVKDLLFDTGYHHLPVVEGPNKKLVGILTSYDLLKSGKTFAEYDHILVREVMTTKVAHLGPREKIGAAAQVFLRKLFHGLPIVNDDHELVGIVTTHDILRYEFDKEYPGDRLEKLLRADEA
ncbi:MAG: CBS domain-containing protein [Saprospiraceae bacterium]|nr:CBS domain-containing protein [Saprospiraceae bacterium]